MRARALALLVLSAVVAEGQGVGSVRGVVRDSIVHRALAGATVQMVSADTAVQFARTVESDSLGRFVVPDVPAGRYRIGFFHPVLDSIGVEPIAREVRVDAGRASQVELTTPSAALLRAAICGARSTADSGAVITGVVRDASNGSPAGGVTVFAEWLEFTFGASGLARRVPKVSAVTRDNGWFAICDVPSPGTMMIYAARGADSTDRVEIEMPVEGYRRRELFLGSASTMVVGDTTRTDSLAPLVMRVRTGAGRLNGIVYSGVGRRPLAGAQVSVSGGRSVRANDRGEWTIVDAPTGTRTLELRAVGYYPEHRTVDVVPGAPRVDVTLLTLKSVLDTIRVTTTLTDRYHSGFEDRRKTSLGRYLTEQDIAKRNVIVTSDLFRMIPGVRLERGPTGESVLLMRSIFMSAEACNPNVYFNGRFIGRMSADDIDDWIKPNEISGVEVYTESNAPPQFQPGLTGCGSIVIWRK